MNSDNPIRFSTRPRGERFHPLATDAEAEVRQIGDLARQLMEVEERLIRQIAEGKKAEVRQIGDLARQLVEAEARLTCQIADCKVAERRLVAEHAVSRIFAASDTLGDAAPQILRAVCESLAWDVGTLWVVDRNANVLRCVEVWHAPEVDVPALEYYTRHITFPPGIGMPGSVWASQSLVWIPDLTTDADSRLPIAIKEGMHGAVGFPIRRGNEFHGVISFFSREVRRPDEKLIEMMNGIGSQISQFIDRKVAERRLVAEHSVSRILAASDTLGDAAPQILRAVCESLGVCPRIRHSVYRRELIEAARVGFPAWRRACAGLPSNLGVRHGPFLRQEVSLVDP